MLDHLANARYHAYLAHDKLMRVNRLNLEDEQKKVAIGSIMADLRFSIKELERELATKKLEAKLQIETKAPIFVFVFGSNLAGRHGKGAALIAVKEYGAVYGRSVGRQGNSYAIPTKDKNLKTLPLDEIAKYVSNFILYAKEHADETFLVTRIGCGLAGYKDKDIAPLFIDAPSNCNLPMGWYWILNDMDDWSSDIE